MTEPNCQNWVITCIMTNQSKQKVIKWASWLHFNASASNHLDDEFATVDLLRIISTKLFNSIQ